MRINASKTQLEFGQLLAVILVARNPLKDCDKRRLNRREAANFQLFFAVDICVFDQESITIKLVSVST